MQKGKVTVQREKKRDEINKLHEKTFRAWVNAQLKKKQMKHYQKIIYLTLLKMELH